MTIKESRFLAESFKAFCADFDYTQTEYTPATIGETAKAIRANPAWFSRTVEALAMNVLKMHRLEPTFEEEYETLQEIAFLANNPRECMYYFWEGANNKTVREFVRAQIESRKAGHPLHY